jgi:anthranilate synthase component 1
MASVHAGAGVVADSVPESEEQETRQKSSAVLEALRQSPRFR